MILSMFNLTSENHLYSLLLVIIKIIKALNLLQVAFVRCFPDNLTDTQIGQFWLKMGVIMIITIRLFYLTIFQQMRNG
ncbi:MAG: hypothetical protein COC04_06280 [Gammaproteobacteria bacterium]|nr:MAG: hypothetical protein COC04_06280 [Gammaproteobacteria bacterium]